MKVFIILSVSIAMSIASLEPSGYRPPGSHQISSELYLPPTDRYSGSSSRGVQTPESHYLPSMSHQSTSQNVIPNSLYLPSNHEQTHTQQNTLSQVLSSDQSVSKPMNQYLPPSNQYLPAITKPTNQYLPSSSSSSMNTNKRQRQNSINTYRQQSSSDISFSSTNRFSNNNNHMTNINNLPSQYLPPNKRPNAFTQAIPSSNYLPANQNDAYQPSDEILPPSNTYLTQNKYESIGNQQHDYSSSNNPSQSSAYPNSGYPQAKNNNNNNNNDNNDNGYNYEPPAKYEFEYMVNDQQSGNDFGHKESRDGDVTRGTYYVLLPDGRKQTVNFIADANGYRPTITYEDAAAAGRDGYDQGYHY